jgi:putative ABC transport system permease protein
MLPDRLRRISRRLWRAPLFTFIAVLTLGVGIGANAAIFSVINGVLLKPLPFVEPDRLVGVWHTAPGIGFPLVDLSPSTYLTYRESGRTLEDIGLWSTFSVTVTGTGEPERIDVLVVTEGTFGVLRIEPQLGRRFTADDDSPRTPERVMLTDAYWRRKFGGDSSVIGRPLVVDGKPREIIGVLPAGFQFLDHQPQIVLPIRLNPAEVRVGNFSFQGVGRLKPGVTLDQANADIARMIPLSLGRFPMPPGMTRKMFDDAKLGPRVRPLSADVIGDVGRVLWVLFGTVGLVLLIACANVANLFLVRAEGRQQELAIHAALGAGRGRVAWELVSESLALGVIGGIVGLGLAYSGVRALVAAAPRGLPLRIAPGGQVRQTSADVGAEGGRPVVERRTRASPPPERARRRRDRDGGRAARRVRFDDTHVPGHASGGSRVHATRRGADAPHCHSGNPGAAG